MWTPDADRAATFYGHVLGWTYDPSTHQVSNTTQHIGIFSVPGRRTLFCCYAVADLEGARQAILDGGGTVDEPQQFDFGTALGATDSLGTAFAVFQPVPSEPRPALNGSGPGELSYITYEVTDRRPSGTSTAACCIRPSSPDASTTAGVFSRPIRCPVSRAEAPRR